MKPMVLVKLPLVLVILVEALPCNVKALLVDPTVKLVVGWMKSVTKPAEKVLVPVNVCPTRSNSATFAVNRASLTVPELRLVAFKLVRLVPLITGKAPASVVWTSWLAPLKLLPWTVTFVLSLASLTVPLLKLVAFKLVRFTALRAGN